MRGRGVAALREVEATPVLADAAGALAVVITAAAGVGVGSVGVAVLAVAAGALAVVTAAAGVGGMCGVGSAGVAVLCVAVGALAIVTAAAGVGEVRPGGGWTGGNAAGVREARVGRARKYPRSVRKTVTVLLRRGSGQVRGSR